MYENSWLDLVQFSAGQFREHLFRMEGQIEKILIISHIKTDQTD